MSKINLDLDDLEIDTFLTTDAPRGILAGVFQAHSQNTTEENCSDPHSTDSYCPCSCDRSYCASCGGGDGTHLTLSVCTICTV
jgi:hypothetical protein